MQHLDGRYLGCDENGNETVTYQWTICVSNLEPLPQFNQAMEDLLGRMRAFVAGYCAGARGWEVIQ